MKYIDTHVHIFPTAVAEKVVRQLENYYGFTSKGKGTVDDLLNAMDRSGIERSVIFSSATKPAQVETINRYIANICMAHPDRFIGFGTMHRDYVNFRDELKRICDDGLFGLKFHPDFQDFDADDPAMLKIYAAAENLILLFHAGDRQCDHSAPERIAHVLDELPHLRVIAAHLGGYSVWERAKNCLIGRDLWIDTSSSLTHLSREDAVDIMRRHGMDRVLFASDYPAIYPQQEIDNIRALHLTNEEEEKVFYRNAEKLFSR